MAKRATQVDEIEEIEETEAEPDEGEDFEDDDEPDDDSDDDEEEEEETIDDDDDDINTEDNDDELESKSKSKTKTETEQPKTTSNVKANEKPPTRKSAHKESKGPTKIVIPSLPSYRLSFEAAKKWFESLTPEQRSYVPLYLYRLYPRVDRRLTDPKAQLNIDKPTGFNKDLIIAEHGGGKYKLTIGDVTGQRGKQIGEAHFEISMVKYPPKLNYEHLLIDEPSNKGYVERLKREGILDENGMPVIGNTRNVQNSGPTTDPTMMTLFAGVFDRLMDRMDNDQLKNRDKSGEDHAVTKAIDMMAAAGEKNLEFVMSQARDSSPEKSMALINGIMTAIGNLVPRNAGNDSNQLFMHMMTIQQQNMQMMVELMKGREQTQGNPGNTGDELGSMNKMLEFMTTAREFFGANGAMGGGSGKRSTLDTVLEHVGPAIPKALDLISNIVAASAMRGRMVPGQPGQAQPGQTQPGMTRTQLLQSQQAQAQAQASALRQQTEPGKRVVNVGDYMANQAVPTTETTETTETGEQSNIDPRIMAAAQIFSQYGEFFKTAINSGKRGWELAEDVISLTGRPIYKQVANIGPDILIAGLQQFPEDWNALVNTYGEQEITTFMQEFCNAEKILANQDSGDDIEEIDEPEPEEIVMPKVVKVSGKKGGK